MSEHSVTSPQSATPDGAGGSPGTILRRCREFHGFTLEEASEATKIGISHLKALEGDQIREFANQVYLKGFLRIYASYLGLSADDMAGMYDKLFGVQGEKQDVPRSAPTASRAPRRLISLKKLIFPVLLLTVILVVASFFREPAPLPPRHLPAVVVSVPTPPNVAAVQGVQSSVQYRKEKKSPPDRPIRHESASPLSELSSPSTHAAEPASKGLILRVKATQNGSLTAIIDGSIPQQYELSVGDVVEWKADKKVTMELSNGGGVDVLLNGKPYKLAGTPGKPLYIELDSEGTGQAQ